jgi:hypothetical protein
LIANYSDLQEQQQNQNQKQESANNSAKSNSNEVSGGTTTVDISSSSSPSRKRKSITEVSYDDLLGPDNSNKPVPQMFRERSLDEQEYTILTMMERTGEDRDVCYFYLESMDWKIDAAIELLKSMAVK